ncbi:MAG: GDP-mannose 4,6-dehydratase [Parachlamydiaceae bacterium]|nr:GDP-mannose 4,6-dehydratase [Parachlamydiaceae bacterium]
MNKKRILITGAAGFIGFHMAKFFHQRGDFVLGFDNFNDYYDPRLKRARANELAKLDISIIEKDINDDLALHEAVNQHEITHLLHLAAQAGVRYSLENPQAYLHANMKGFLSILEVCRKQPKMPLIYASSSSVYGLNQKIPFSIEDRTDHQASFYGVTKKSNELMAQTYHHLYGISVTGLRFFTAYGPWGRPDMAYFSFTRAILDKRPIDVYNQGQMFRDFTYIDDIVKGTAAAVDQSYPCALFNLGNNQPEELSHLIELLEKELGIKAEKNFLPIQPGDVLSTFADIKESEEKLNFNPKTSLKEGVGHFIRWYKEYYKV